jgi:uncharacterized protein (DUF302 family)
VRPTFVQLGFACLFLTLTACKSTVLQPNIHEPSDNDLNRSVKTIESAIYEVQVDDGVSYQDVIDSLKSVSEGMNFVNPANFPIGEHMKLRGIDPQGIKEVHSFCNLSMGTDIMLDHPEFLVFAPCRVALYEKLNANQQRKLFIGMARPTHDLKSIQLPTPRAQKAAQDLENALIQLLNKAKKGDI